MKRNLIQSMLLTALLAAPLTAFAAHGPLLSTQRDAWINDDVDDLVAAGLVPTPSKPVAELTNLEVAELTSQAGETLMAQAPGMAPALPLPPAQTLPDTAPPMGSTPLIAPGAMEPPAANPLASSAARSFDQLVQEFQDELSAMGVDVPQLEDRIYQIEHNTEYLAALQQKYLARTGTNLSGFSRGWMNLYRGFGSDPAYGPFDYNADIFGQMNLTSIPVPDILFDTRLRLWRTIGMYYADPIAKNGGEEIELKWISLTSYNQYVQITAGDFLQNYTPLTLWNYDVPVYTLIEPTSYYRTRKDVEDLVSMNYDNDWRLRGFKAATSIEPPKNPFFDALKIEAMAGPLDMANPFQYASYFSGSQASLHFFGDNLELKGAGLMLWDDAGSVEPSTNVLYNPKEYQIGSLSGRLNLPFTKDVSLGGTGEYAGSHYQDNLNDPNSVLEDWAARMQGYLNIYGFHVSAKYLNVGPYFYSPGAQTNRYTPAAGEPGYLPSSNYWEDDALVGYLNNFPFQGQQGVGQPFYAPYDRTEENVLPYGDATPNREGLIAAMSLDIGKDGWLKPQGRWLVPAKGLQMQEIQPNYVLEPSGLSVVPVDSANNTTVARVFGGYEAAITADLAKAFSLKNRTYQLAFDYKNQTTNLGNGASPFTVDTSIAAADFSVPFDGFEKVVLSVSYEMAKATGSEYVLPGLGDPPDLASYTFYLDSSAIGSYVYTPLDITRTSWSFGFFFPVSDDINFHGDCFLNQYDWPDAPFPYSRQDVIWRFTYEAKF